MAYDGTDEKALERRMAFREQHLAGAKILKDKGSFIEGGAMLDDAGKMIGSVMIVAFNTKEEFDAWFAQEPYVTGKVWESVEVKPFRRAVV